MNTTILHTAALKNCDHCGARCLSYLARWTGNARQVWRRCACCGGNSFERKHRWLSHTVLDRYGIAFDELPCENVDSEIPNWISESTRKGL